MIRTEALTKRYGNLTAVAGVSLRVAEGEIFGLLGPNGAGKTTLINMLCGLLEPSSGTISVGGRDASRELFEIKKTIGVVPQDLAIYEELAAAENVRFFASLYGLKGAALKAAVAESLEFTGLADAARRQPRTFSGGMKRRLNIACGLAHKPRLVFLDEPTVGIDPQSRAHILDAVRRLNAEGRTVVYTTHYMEEAESLCRRCAILDHGKIIAEGTVPELRALVKSGARLVVRTKGERSVDLAGLGKVQGVLGATVEGNKVVVEVDRGVDNLPLIVAFLSGSGVPVLGVETDEPDLEMVFLALTGRKVRD